MECLLEITITATKIQDTYSKKDYLKNLVIKQMKNVCLICLEKQPLKCYPVVLLCFIPNIKKLLCSWCLIPHLIDIFRCQRRQNNIINSIQVRMDFAWQNTTDLSEELRL